MLVVMPDAALNETVSNVINSAFGSAGQRCLAGSVVVTVGEDTTACATPLWKLPDRLL